MQRQRLCEFHTESLLAKVEELCNAYITESNSETVIHERVKNFARRIEGARTPLLSLIRGEQLNLW